MEKTTVFNLIILDESGSMAGVTRQTIAGCNETLNVIRSLEKEHGDTQRNLVSIYVFQTDAKHPSRYLCKNKPIGEVADVKKGDYQPWGCTPLLDAVGSTLTDLEAVASTHEDATATVTVITDGMENSSTDYTWKKVRGMISRLKEKGWTFNFIGANIDVREVSEKLDIDNSLSFISDERGTEEMWDTYAECLKKNEEERICMEKSIFIGLPQEERYRARAKRSKKFFAK